MYSVGKVFFPSGNAVPDISRNFIRGSSAKTKPVQEDKNMVITESIQKAIQTAIKKSGSVLSFARTIGVSHTTVTYWLTGRTRKINATVWQNLLPLIGEYLDPGESMTYPYGPVAAGANCVLREQSPVWYGAGPAHKAAAPLLHLSDLADFDPQIDPIEEIIREKSGKTAAFTSQVMPGHFAVEVDKEQKGFFPAGTRLLLRWPDAPGDGDTVLAKLRGKKEFLFAVYTRKSSEIVLAPLLKGGTKRVIPKADFHNVCSWIVSIREAIQLF